MTERPILFNREMILALHSGRKTQTRRIMNPQPKWCADWGTAVGMNGAWLIGSPAALGYADSGDHWQAVFDEDTRRRYCTQEAYGWGAHAGCPYGVVGDRLWVREAWRVSAKHDATAPRDLPFERGLTIMYDAGGSRSKNAKGEYENDAFWPHWPADRPTWAGKGRPSIHMPRAASRTDLEVTAVRIERLQDISEADAQDEGVEYLREDAHYWRNYQTHSLGPHCIDYTCLSARDSYRTLWDSINEARGFGWDTNPWVWVVEFPCAF